MYDICNKCKLCIQLKKGANLYSGGRLQIENDIGHDEWDGAILLRMYENLHLLERVLIKQE